MSAGWVIQCDAPFCPERWESRHSLEVLRRMAKRNGWVKARTNNRDADYCPEHANYRTKQ